VEVANGRRLSVSYVSVVESLFWPRVDCIARSAKTSRWAVTANQAAFESSEVVDQRDRTPRQLIS